jgi:signal transduction histidine kinase
MKWEAISQNSLRWTFRLIEWITLAIALAIFFLDDIYAPPKSPWLLCFYPLLFLLSFEFPIHRPRRQQRLYLAAQMILAIVSSWFIAGLDQYFFLILIKACILLARKEVILWAIISGIFYVSGAAWWIFFVDWSDISPKVSINLSLGDKWRAFLTLLIGHIGLTVYVLLLGFFVAAERRSRQRAEHLTLEVQELAAQLERSRIAREIHDSLGHSLVALGVQLEVAQKFEDDIPPKLQHAVKMSKQLADDCLNDVRRSLHSLRQGDLEFQQALQQFMQTLFAPPLEIKIEINLPQLPATLSNQLYFILKEGLMNIQKHANAEQVVLKADATDDEILLTLMDDGCGFELDMPTTGLGLQGMGERARLIGGELTLNSAIGQGTTLHVRIPR